MTAVRGHLRTNSKDKTTKEVLARPSSVTNGLFITLATRPNWGQFDESASTVWYG
jgi:hypothetical protein